MMISMALRRSVSIYADYWGMPIPPYWGNFQTALFDLLPSMVRTLVVTILSVLGILMFAAPASYGFARISAPGKSPVSSRT